MFRSHAHLRTVRRAVFRNIKMNEPGILLEKRQQKEMTEFKDAIGVFL